MQQFMYKYQHTYNTATRVSTCRYKLLSTNTNCRYGFFTYRAKNNWYQHVFDINDLSPSTGYGQGFPITRPPPGCQFSSNDINMFCLKSLTGNDVRIREQTPKAAPLLLYICYEQIHGFLPAYRTILETIISRVSNVMSNGWVSHTPPDDPCVVSPTVNPWVVSVLTIITLML